MSNDAGWEKWLRARLDAERSVMVGAIGEAISTMRFNERNITINAMRRADRDWHGERIKLEKLCADFQREVADLRVQVRTLLDLVQKDDDQKGDDAVIHWSRRHA